MLCITGSKKVHFRKLHEATEIPYSEMVGLTDACLSPINLTTTCSFSSTTKYVTGRWNRSVSARSLVSLLPGLDLVFKG